MNVTITVTVAEGGQGETQRAVSHSLGLSVHGFDAAARRALITEKSCEVTTDVVNTFADCIDAEEAESVDDAAA